jgi:hypothetical protein
MSRSAKIVKDAMKKGVEEKPTFGTDPNDPWSARANITETALLNRYLKSRGINPEFATKDMKVAHSKTNAFKTWLQAHVNDSLREGMTMKHTPTEKRLHALKRSLHYGQEIRVAGNGHKKLHSEAVDKRDTVVMDIPFLIRMLEYAREDAKTDMDLHKVVEKLIQIRNKGALTMKDYKFVVAIREEIEQIVEDTYHDSMAATQMPFDGANNPDDVLPPKRKNMKEMSKSARIIKSIYKKKNVKEELYDHEKEDKSVASYGKKPKMQKPGMDPETKESPQAAAVLSGGKTLTGADRDTIEIDPMMKTRKQALISQKSIK